MTKELLYVLDTIKNHDIFKNNDFRLVGGTALSYHIKHRLSEDLDFFLLEKLPREDIDCFIEFCIDEFGEERVVPMPLSDSAIYDFTKNGEDVNDYQQDWNINGVKVTFAECSENTGLNDLLMTDRFSLIGNIKITSVETIFKMKSLMFYKRTKSRDYFDLLTLYQQGYTPKLTLQIIQQYELAYQGVGINLLFELLRHQEYNSNMDEPLTGLTTDIRSFSEMKTELIELIQKKS